MIPNGEGREWSKNLQLDNLATLAKPKGRRWYYLGVKKAFLRGITSKKLVIVVVSITFSPLEGKANLNRLKAYLKIKIIVMK